MFYLPALTNKSSQGPRRLDFNLELGLWNMVVSGHPLLFPPLVPSPTRGVLSQVGVDTQCRAPALSTPLENCSPPVTP